jgi:hypothetical protein
MKAPEKLYIGRRNYGPLIGGWESQPFSSKEIESIEYIRKDALLEWANKRLEEFRHIAEISNDVAADGEVDAFEELIDKLNSM